MSWLDHFLWPRRAISNLEADMAAVRLGVLGLPTRLTRLENIIMATAEDLAARIDAATNEVASDLKAVRDELAAVAAAAEVDKQAAVDAALAKLDAPIARLEALGADPADPVPAPEPADEPADEPAPTPDPVDEPPAA